MRIKKKYSMLLLLFIGYLLAYIDKTVIGLTMINIETDLNLRPQDIGYISGLFFLSYSIFQIPAGWLNDRIGYKKVLLLSLVIIGICACLFGAIGSTITLLLWFRFLAGIGHAGYPSSCAKAVSTNFMPDQRVLAQSVLLSSAGAAMVIGPILISYALTTIGWHNTYISLGVVAFTIALSIWFLVPNGTRDNRPYRSDSGNKIAYYSLLKNPLVILFFIANFAVNIPIYGLIIWLPKYLVQVRGLDLTWIAYIMAIGGMASWLASISSGWIVSNFLKNREKQFIFTCTILATIGIWLVYYSTSLILSVVCLSITYVLLAATFVTLFTLPMKWLSPNIIGSVIGLVNAGSTLGGFVSPVIIGIIIASAHNSAHGNFSYAFMFLSGGSILAALTVLLIKKPQSA